MEVFILTDLEGISGVLSIDCIEKKPDYADACKKLEKSLNFAICVLRENGAEKIYYLDGHGGGGNIDPSAIDPFAEKTTIAGWQELIRSGEIDFQIELGCHTRAGTLGGFLDHTMSSKKWFSYEVNGREYGELGIHALFCGAYGVPVAMCSGDDAACEQAKEYIPGIITAAVKHADCRNLCVDYPDADAILEKALISAARGYKDIKPLTTSLPAEIRLTYYRSDMCDEVFTKAPAGVVRESARTLSKRISRITSYDELKF